MWYVRAMSQLELLDSGELHTRVIQEAVLMAEDYVWIATANLKDMHIPMAGKRYRPILEAGRSWRCSTTWPKRG